MAFAAALLAPGCTREHEQEPAREEGITVKLFVDGMATKGEDDILSGYLYLFDDVSDAPFKTVAIDASGTTVLDFSDFGSDPEKVKRTTVFAVTDGSGSAQTPSSLENLKNMPIGTPLFLDDSGKKVKADPGFYMTAQGTFEKVDDNTTTCNLTLKRLAAKLTLEVAYASPITTTGTWKFKADEEYLSTTTWTPMTSGQNTRVYLENAVSNTVIGAASTPVAKPGTYTMFKYDPVYMGGVAVSDPFYSYPVSWTAGTESEPFIKLIQPWRYTTTVVKEGKNVVVDENVVELYYKVMVPTTLTALEANTWYQPKVTLKILGGEADRPTVIGADGLTVMDWKGVTSSEMPAVTINPSDFLVPERETFEVSNGNPLQIKYFASGEVGFTVKEIYKDVYLNNDTERRYIYSTDPSHTYLSSIPIQDTDVVKDRYNREFSDKDDKTGTETAWFTNSAFDTATKSGTLTLNHTLSDDFDLPNFAARPYHYEVELSLKDNSSVKKTITIIQNPPVLVEGKKSTGLVYVNNNTSSFGSIYRARTSNSDNPISSVNAQVASGYYFNIGEAHKSEGVSSDYNKLGNLNTYAYLDPSGSNSCQWRIRVSVAPKAGLFVSDPRDKTLSEVSIPASPTAADLAAAAAQCNELYGFINMRATKSGSTFTWNLENASVTNDDTEQTVIKSYYWPTAKKDGSSLGTSEFLPEIAPEFLMASSYGKDGAMTYAAAVNRCLAYQEDGYPAGRWRVPTEAEIDYCLHLQDCGAIPTLFTRTATGYWGASGRIMTNAGWINKKTSGNNHAYIRCVYDTWYWGRDEVSSLKTNDFGNTNMKQYNWSGYKEEYMKK